MKKLCHEDVINILPDRIDTAHKGDFGKMLLICGSKGYTGAAALAAIGALRSGGGLVFLGVPDCIYQIEAVKLLEPIVFSLPDKQGMLSKDAIDGISARMVGMDAVLIGPGLGRSKGTFAVTKFVLTNFAGPVILDADGLNVIGAHKDILRGRVAPTVITPHEGEFVRLGGDLSQGREEGACRMARDLGCIVVLKGHETVITDGSETYVNGTGNPGMAVGGSGDVLAGIITSFIAQGITPITAAAISVWLHGAAGDLCAQEIGKYGMLPSDILNALPRLMK